MGYLGAAHSGNIRIIKLEWFKPFCTMTTAIWEDGLKHYRLKGQQVLIMQKYLSEWGKIKCSLISRYSTDNWKKKTQMAK